MTNKTTPNDDWLSELVYMALGEESAVFMSQPIKGTEIVMPEKELTVIAERLKQAINAKITELLVEARVDELEKLFTRADGDRSAKTYTSIVEQRLRVLKAQLQASQPMKGDK